MTRDTYEANMQFMEEILKRIEQNTLGIDELESVSAEFASARQFCAERLSRIEAGLAETLKPADQPAQA